MSPLCLFCDNPAGSEEHLWAAWIHKRKDFGPLKVTIGNSPQEIRNDPEQKIRTVCGDCNNGWMGAIENKNKPAIACMFQDLAIPLDRQRQTHCECADSEFRTRFGPRERPRAGKCNDGCTFEIHGLC